MKTAEKFKVLMHGKIFVDANLLEKGIYETKVPALYISETTIEDKIEIAKKVQLIVPSFKLENYIENINKCELVDWYLQPLPEQESKSAETILFNKFGCKTQKEFEGTVDIPSEWIEWILEAMNEYAQSHKVEMPGDGNLARNLHNWSDTHLDGDITLKDCYELINYFETLRKSGTLTLIR